MDVCRKVIWGGGNLKSPLHAIGFMSYPVKLLVAIRKSFSSLSGLWKFQGVLSGKQFQSSLRFLGDALTHFYMCPPIFNHQQYFLAVSLDLLERGNSPQNLIKVWFYLPRIISIHPDSFEEMWPFFKKSFSIKMLIFVLCWWSYLWHYIWKDCFAHWLPENE